MKKIYMASVLLFAIGGFLSQAHAQTHDNEGVNISKDKHAQYDKDTDKVSSDASKILLSKAAVEAVILEQNTPVSVSKRANIRFYIPQSVKSAILNVHAKERNKIDTYPIEERGSGQFTFHAHTLSSGTYLYDLITDGIASETRKMVITK